MSFLPEAPLEAQDQTKINRLFDIIVRTTSLADILVLRSARQAEGNPSERASCPNVVLN